MEGLIRDWSTEIAYKKLDITRDIHKGIIITYINKHIYNNSKRGEKLHLFYYDEEKNIYGLYEVWEKFPQNNPYSLLLSNRYYREDWNDEFIINLYKLYGGDIFYPI